MIASSYRQVFRVLYLFPPDTILSLRSNDLLAVFCLTTRRSPYSLHDMFAPQTLVQTDGEDIGVIVYRSNFIVFNSVTS